MQNTNPNKVGQKKNEEVEKLNALQRRQSRRKNRGGSAIADWGSADPILIQKLIETVTFQHGTITMGYTRDNGAYYVSYYFGAESEAVYCRPSEGINEFLEGEIEAFEA